jgi:large subunit ribosomal protein L3
MAIHGIIGKKIGMTQIFRPDGRIETVTAIQAGPCMVTQIKTVDKDKYEAVQLGFQPVKRLNKPETGHLTKTGSTDTKFRFLREMSADSLEDIEIGQQFGAGVFEAGDRVDIIGLSKGRGFAGGVRRHNFSGGPKTHGQSDRHRAPGSIGAGTSPGHVLKGLKMAGHMGNARVTVENIKVAEADAEKNILFVNGSVPGARDSLVLIRKVTRRGR